MPTPDPKENPDFLKLLEEGKEKGSLTYLQVSEALAQNEDLDADGIQEILDALHDEGIDVLDRARPDPPPALRSEPGMSADEVAAVEGPIDDSVRMWLREVGRTPLLRHEDEVRLAKRIEAGEAARVALRDAGSEALPHAEVERLRKLDDQAQKAKEILIRANLRLVVAIAKKYSGRGLLFPDLIQEGNIGLIKAVGKFDHGKGYKFSTYATWWIRQSITRAIADHSRTIRIPVHMVELINRLLKTSSSLQQALGREPTMDEIASELGMPVDRVMEISRIAPEPLSLEMPIGEEDESHLGDFIEDRGTPSPDDAAGAVFLREEIATVLAALSDRERDVIRLRFGLDDGYPRTLEEVGKRFNLTRERIRQIEAKALKKLRLRERNKRLRDFAE